VDKKILILGVDRDNDIGEKTGIKGPIIGREPLEHTALKLGIADPTESDTNVLFHCIKLYNQLVAEGKDVYVACVTGDKNVGMKSDIIITEQLDDIVAQLHTNEVILVSDGKEDENILPVLQSRMPIMSIERVTVQQNESLEDTYFILHRYVKKLLEDRKVSGIFVGLPGIILFIYAMTYLFPEYTRYGWFAIFTFAGLYLFTKGFGLDDYFREQFSPRRVKAIAYTVSLGITVYGAYNGFQNIQWSMVPYVNLESVRYVFTVFFDGSFPWLFVGIIAALGGNVISAYLRDYKYMWNNLVVFFLACAIFATVYQYTAYTQNEITRNEVVFSIILIGFLTIMGTGISLLQKSRLMDNVRQSSRVPITRKKIVTIFVLSFILVSLVLYVRDTQETPVSADFTFAISSNLADQLNPAMGYTIDERPFAVWQDNRNGNWDIYLKYLDTNEVVNISSDASDQKNPRVWRDRVVWQDARNGNLDIYLYYVSSGNLMRITSNSGGQTNPDIYENRIVWEDDRNGNSDIYMYDLGTNMESLITIEDPGLQPFQTTPRIYEDTIVWLDNRFGEFNIFSYNISTGAEEAITSGRSIKFKPEIYGQYIVWEDNRNGNWDIYMYDLDEENEQQVTTLSSNQINPALHESYLVWEDDANGNRDIFLHNIETGELVQVTSRISDQENACISDRYIIWVDWRNDLDGIQTDTSNDNPDIYGMTLEDAKALAQSE
jgi:beta propeller repeat protein